MIQPGSPYYLKPILKNANPFSAIKNPYRTNTDIETGARLFRSECVGCHGGDGPHTSGPDLTSGKLPFIHSDWALFRVITRGIPGTAMTAKKLDEKRVWQIIAYLRSIHSEHLSNTDPAEAINDNSPDRIAVSAVDFERLLRAEDEPDHWLTYSGAYNGQRYSRLADLNNHNVTDLTLKWVYQMEVDELYAETTPLVVDGVMFFTQPSNEVTAIDAFSGQPIWSYKHPLREDLSLCCGQRNRGVAVYGDKVYSGTLDAHLIALDIKTGKLVWDIEVADSAVGFSITAAPLALNNMIVVGVSGGEFGIRGFVDAYDAVTGKRIWRTYTVPATGEPGNNTWSGDSWRTGGGPTWMIGSFDPKLNLVYWGVGNPAPDFDGDQRLGDNLYTNSVIALDADSGKLKWHFQFTPHDEHDWDANQVPVLVDTEFQGKPRKLLLTANKNGFGYVLDRNTGEFLFAHETAKQTWAVKIDSQGRPVKKPNIGPSTEGTLLYPGVAGAANWWPPSYSPATHLFYVPLLERASLYFNSPVEFEKGQKFTGSAGQPVSGLPHYTAIRAFVPGNDQPKWEFKLPPRHNWASIGGTLATAGNLVLFGDRDLFFALDAANGDKLWSINLGSPVHAAPMTYRSLGKQQITVAAGRSLFTFGLPDD